MKILLVDDHAVVRQGYASLLGALLPDVQISEAASGEEALAQVQVQIPNLVVLDIGLPQVDGLQLMRRMLRHYPDLRVLIYTAQEEEVYARLAFNAGASGFVSKGRPMPQLIAAIDALSQGERSFPDFINPCLQEEVEETLALTPKELQVIGLLSQGLSNVQIADMLNISNKTVSTHKNTILRKTGAKNLFELAAVYKELQQ